MTRTLLLAALLVAPLSVRADDAKPGIDAEAKKIVEKAIEAEGGKEAIEKNKASSAKVKGEMSLFGLDIPFTGEIVTMDPDKISSQIDATMQGQQLSIVQIVNGDKVKSTMNGMPTPMDDAQKKELKQMPLMMEVTSLVPLLKGDKFTVKAEKDEKVGDADASVVLITGKDLKDVRMFFDKKTGLPLKTVRKGLGLGAGPEPVEVTEETVISDWKTVDGVKMPSKSVVNHDGKKFMTMEMTEMKLMEKADPKKFAIDD